MSNMLLISLLAFACMAAHLAIQRNPGHPGVVHGAVWLLISLGYAVFQAELDLVKDQSLLVLAIGIVAFSIGIYAGGRPKGFSLAVQGISSRQFPVPVLIILVSMIGLAAMAAKAIQYVPLEPGMSLFGGVDSWYATLRNDLIARRSGSFGISSYVLNISFAGTAYLILYFRRVHKTPWVWLSIVLSLGFTLLSTGRTFFLLLGCLIIGSAMPVSWRNRKMLFLAAPLLVVIVFVLLPWLGGRLSAASLEYLAKMYSFAPLSAFDYLVNSGSPTTAGSMTFRTPFAVLRALGVPVDVPELIQQYSPTRFPANVYTVFSPYFRDFGMIGVGLFMGILGGVHGRVFRQLKSGIPIIIVANSLLFYALLMQFFQDQYFSLMSQWIQILFWTYVFNTLRPLPQTGRSNRMP